MHATMTRPSDACGVGTPWGCRHHMADGAHYIMGLPLEGGGVGNRLFHAGTCCPCPNCLGLIEVVPNAFSRGLARERMDRIVRAAS